MSYHRKQQNTRLRKQQKNLAYFNHNNISTYIGVSLYSSDLQQISKAFFQAIDAMKLGRKLYPEENVFLFRTIQVYQWLSTMPQESLEEMYRDTIEP